MLGLIIVPIAKIYNHNNDLLDDELFYGYIVSILDVTEKTYYIQTEYDLFGYVDKSNVLITNANTDYHHLISSHTVDILSEPKYESNIIISLPKCSKINIKKVINDKWSKVSLHDNKVGYITNNDYIDLHYDDSTNLRETVVNTALALQGTNYRWGGKSILGIDCSGLIHLSYMMINRIIYRNSDITEDILNQYDMKHIPKEDLQPADLIYIPGHVMMYIGKNQVIHASQTHTKVVINSIDPNDETYINDLNTQAIQYIRCIHD